MCAVDAGVNEGEPVEEFAEQYREPEYAGEYREPEPEYPYHEQELPEGFEDGKSNLFLWCIFWPSFSNTTYWPVFKTGYCFTAETRLDSHPLIFVTIPW